MWSRRYRGSRGGATFFFFSNSNNNSSFKMRTRTQFNYFLGSTIDECRLGSHRDADFVQVILPLTRGPGSRHSLLIWLVINVRVCVERPIVHLSQQILAVTGDVDFVVDGAAVTNQHLGIWVGRAGIFTWCRHFHRGYANEPTWKWWISAKLWLKICK